MDFNMGNPHACIDPTQRPPQSRTNHTFLFVLLGRVSYAGDTATDEEEKNEEATLRAMNGG